MHPQESLHAWQPYTNLPAYVSPDATNLQPNKSLQMGVFERMQRSCVSAGGRQESVPQGTKHCWRLTLQPHHCHMWPHPQHVPPRVTDGDNCRRKITLPLAAGGSHALLYACGAARRRRGTPRHHSCAICCGRSVLRCALASSSHVASSSCSPSCGTATPPCRRRNRISCAMPLPHASLPHAAPAVRSDALWPPLLCSKSTPCAVHSARLRSLRA